MKYLVTGYSGKVNGFCCIVEGTNQKDALLNLPNTPAAREAMAQLLTDSEDETGIVVEIDVRTLLVRLEDAEAPEAVYDEDGPRWCFELFITPLDTTGANMPNIVCW